MVWYGGIIWYLIYCNGDVCNTVALTRLPADRSRGGSEGGWDVVQGGRVAWGQRRWKRWTICICHKVALKLIICMFFGWSFHINIRQASLAHLKLTSLPSRKESRSWRVCGFLLMSKLQISYTSQYHELEIKEISKSCCCMFPSYQFSFLVNVVQIQVLTPAVIWRMTQ